MSDSCHYVRLGRHASRIRMSRWCFQLLILGLIWSSCGSEWTTRLAAKYYPLTEKIYKFGDDHGGDRTHQYIYIKAAATETAPFVEAELTSSPDFPDCDDSDIRVYSGDGEEDGLYIGSICGGAFKDTFPASYNAMFIKINASSIPEYFILTVTYYTVKECRSALLARSAKYLRTPTYRVNGLYTAIYSCRWTLSALEDKRIRFTFQYSQGHTQCNSNVTMIESETDSFYSQRTFATWCGGEDNVFVSVYRHVLVTVHTSGRGLPPLEMQFLAENEDVCYERLKVRKGEGGNIQSPWYSYKIVDLKVCRWYVKTQPGGRGVIRINVSDTDLADTPGCTKDVVKVYDASDSNSPVTVSWCGTQTPVVDLYTSAVMVEYRTGTNHLRTYRGFKLNYFYASEPLCSYSLLASRTKQKLTSPGYPNPFRSYLKCVWKISSNDPVLVIKLDVIRSDLEKIPRSLCGRSRLMVYEGIDESAPLLKTWCQDEQMTLQSKGQHLLVVFLSENNHLDQREGFSMEYSEGQYSESLEPTPQEQSITFPGQSYYYVKGYDAHWYFYTTQSLHHIALRFTYVNLHCPSDVIAIYDGEKASTNDIYTFCGNDQRSHFSKTNRVTVVFTTRTNKGRGFTMSYKLSYYPGCFKRVQEVNAETAEAYLLSPGIDYYDNMDCSWRFIAVRSSDLVRLYIHSTNIVTYNPKTCPSDYIRAYDGYDMASKKFEPLICGINKDRRLESSSRYIYLEFHSDHIRTGQGFKITYSSFSPDTKMESLTSSFPTATVVGVVMGVVVILGMLIAICICRRWRRASLRATDPPDLSENTAAIQYTRPPSRENPSAPPIGDFISSEPPVSELPPSYDEVQHLTPSIKDDEVPPPSYIEAVSEGMVRFVSSEPSQHGYV